MADEPRTEENIISWELESFAEALVAENNDLLNNADLLAAARADYNAIHGEGAWAARVEEERSDLQSSADSFWNWTGSADEELANFNPDAFLLEWVRDDYASEAAAMTSIVSEATYFQFSQETLNKLDNIEYAADIQRQINDTIARNYEALGDRTASIEAAGWLSSRAGDLQVIQSMIGEEIPELALIRAQETFFTDYAHVLDLQNLGNFDRLEGHVESSLERYEFASLNITQAEYVSLNPAERSIVTTEAEHLSGLLNAQGLARRTNELNELMGGADIDTINAYLETNIAEAQNALGELSAIENPTMREQLELSSAQETYMRLEAYSGIATIMQDEEILQVLEAEGDTAYWLAIQEKALSLLENAETPEEAAFAQEINAVFQEVKPEDVTYDYTRFGYATATPDPDVRSQYEIENDPDWLRAVAIFYGEKEQSFTTDFDVEFFENPENAHLLESLQNGVVPEDLPDEAIRDLSNWGARTARFFTMNTGVAANIAMGFEEKYGANGAEAAIAFQRMLDSYNNFGFFNSWRATGETAVAVVGDPINIAAVGVGAFTAGAGGAAIRGAAEAGKQGLRYTLARVVQNQILNNGVRGALVAGYAEGTTAGVIQSWAEQTAEIGSGKTDGYSVTRMLLQSQAEGLMGAGFSGGGHFVGRLFTRGASDVAPAPRIEIPPAAAAADEVAPVRATDEAIPVQATNEALPAAEPEIVTPRAADEVAPEAVADKAPTVQASDATEVVAPETIVPNRATEEGEIIEPEVAPTPSATVAEVAPETPVRNGPILSNPLGGPRAETGIPGMRQPNFSGIDWERGVPRNPTPLRSPADEGGRGPSVDTSSGSSPDVVTRAPNRPRGFADDSNNPMSDTNRLAFINSIDSDAQRNAFISQKLDDAQRLRLLPQLPDGTLGSYVSTLPVEVQSRAINDLRAPDLRDSLRDIVAQLSEDIDATPTRTAPARPDPEPRADEPRVDDTPAEEPRVEEPRADDTPAEEPRVDETRADEPTNPDPEPTPSGEPTPEDVRIKVGEDEKELFDLSVSDLPNINLNDLRGLNVEQMDAVDPSIWAAINSNGQIRRFNPSQREFIRNSMLEQQALNDAASSLNPGARTAPDGTSPRPDDSTTARPDDGSTSRPDDGSAPRPNRQNTGDSSLRPYSELSESQQKLRVQDAMVQRMVSESGLLDRFRNVRNWFKSPEALAEQRLDKLSPSELAKLREETIEELIQRDSRIVSSEADRTDANSASIDADRRARVRASITPNSNVPKVASEWRLKHIDNITAKMVEDLKFKQLKEVQPHILRELHDAGKLDGLNLTKKQQDTINGRIQDSRWGDLNDINLFNEPDAAMKALFNLNGKVDSKGNASAMPEWSQIQAHIAELDDIWGRTPGKGAGLSNMNVRGLFRKFMRAGDRVAANGGGADAQDKVAEQLLKDLSQAMRQGLAHEDALTLLIMGRVGGLRDSFGRMLQKNDKGGVIPFNFDKDTYNHVIFPTLEGRQGTNWYEDDMAMKGIIRDRLERLGDPNLLKFNPYRDVFAQTMAGRAIGKTVNEDGQVGFHSPLSVVKGVGRFWGYDVPSLFLIRAADNGFNVLRRPLQFTGYTTLAAGYTALGLSMGATVAGEDSALGQFYNNNQTIVDTVATPLSFGLQTGADVLGAYSTVPTGIVSGVANLGFGQNWDYSLYYGEGAIDLRDYTSMDGFSSDPDAPSRPEPPRRPQSTIVGGLSPDDDGSGAPDADQDDGTQVADNGNTDPANGGDDPANGGGDPADDRGDDPANRNGNGDRQTRQARAVSRPREGYSLSEAWDFVMPSFADGFLDRTSTGIEFGRVGNTVLNWLGDAGTLAGGLFGALPDYLGKTWGTVAQIGTMVAGALIGKNILTGAMNFFKMDTFKSVGMTAGLALVAGHVFDYASGAAEHRTVNVTNSDYGLPNNGSTTINSGDGERNRNVVTPGDDGASLVRPSRDETMVTQAGGILPSDNEFAAADAILAGQRTPTLTGTANASFQTASLFGVEDYDYLPVESGEARTRGLMRGTDHSGSPITLASIETRGLDGNPMLTRLNMSEISREGERQAAETGYGYVAAQNGLNVENVAPVVASTFVALGYDEDGQRRDAEHLPAALRGGNGSEIRFDVSPQLAAADVTGWGEGRASSGTITPEGPSNEGPISFHSLA